MAVQKVGVVRIPWRERDRHACQFLTEDQKQRYGRYADPRVGLLEGAVWESLRPFICRTLGHAPSPDEALATLRQQLDHISDDRSGASEGPQSVWDYITGAAETETTMRRNRHALDCLALRPRVLRDVSHIDATGSVLGHRLRIPVVLAPIGSLQTITPDGGIAVTRAAAEFGVINLVSTVTEPSLEEIAASTDHPKIFQIYIRGDETWVEKLIDRVTAADYAALTLTVDSAYDGRRERQLLTGWRPPSMRGYGEELRS